jgi:hypothetical protein
MINRAKKLIKENKKCGLRYYYYLKKTSQTKGIALTRKASQREKCEKNWLRSFFLQKHKRHKSTLAALNYFSPNFKMNNLATNCCVNDRGKVAPDMATWLGYWSPWQG